MLLISVAANVSILAFGKYLDGHTGSTIDSLNQRNHFHHPVPHTNQPAPDYQGSKQAQQVNHHNKSDHTRTGD
ncbi:uncharacterized protein METZ01_LOCUS17806 [marine metagenome]|uniref:Uncharacterized protein n=1 Tax=marine metagenome TaxID=408172 RepID=A0A381PD91_9ZZZZ